MVTIKMSNIVTFPKAYSSDDTSPKPIKHNPYEDSNSERNITLGTSAALDAVFESLKYRTGFKQGGKLTDIISASKPLGSSYIDMRDFTVIENTQSIYRGDNNMDNNDILMKYMEKVDRDQSDLKQDLRASEKRMTEYLQRIEERMDNRLNRIEDTATKISNNLDDIVIKVYDKLDDNRKWNIGFIIGVFLSIVALAGTSIYSIIQILSTFLTNNP